MFCLKHLLTAYIINDLIPSGIGMRSIFCFGLTVSINDFCSNFCHLDTEASHFQKCCTCVHFLSRIVSHFSSCNAQKWCQIVFEEAIFSWDISSNFLVYSYWTCNLPVRKTAIKRISKINFTPLYCNATEWCPFSSIQPFGHIDFDIRSLYLMQVTDLGRLIFDQFDQLFVAMIC